jgi:hypothetical protein
MNDAPKEKWEEAFEIEISKVIARYVTTALEGKDPLPSLPALGNLKNIVHSALAQQKAKLIKNKE